MASPVARRAAAPSTSRRRLPSVSVSLGNGADSGDEEEGEISLAPFVATPRALSNATTSPPGRNDGESNESGADTRVAPNDLSSKAKPNYRSILDWFWFLGRNAHPTSEDVTNDPEPRGQRHQHDTEDDFLEIGDVQDICPACTTPYCQAVDSIPFMSSLKLTYNDPMSQRWLIGKNYDLHETLDGSPVDEYVPLVEAYEALKILAPKVPIPKVRAGWKENGKILTITDNVPGERLYDIWWDLSGTERENIAKQVAQHIESWRESDLGRISSLMGGPVHCHKNLFGATEGGFGPFESDLELWQAIEKRLKKKDIDQDTIQLLKSYMPPSSPCVFTHGDVSSTNILVRDGQVVAITGFENAASLPAWAEDVSMHFCYCAEDEQWKALLSKHTRRRYRPALDWWSLWTAAEDEGTGLVELKELKDRCRRWRTTEILEQPFRSMGLGREDGVARRMNVQPAEAGETEMRVGNLSESLWECDMGDEGGGSADDGSGPRPKKSGAVRKHDLAPHRQIQQRRHTLASSASGPPRQTAEAVVKEHGELVSRPPSGKQNSAFISTPYSDVQSEPGDGPDLSEDTKSEPKGLRPLSLPSFALSESTRAELRSAGKGEAERTTSPSSREAPAAARSLSAIREDVPIDASVAESSSRDGAGTGAAAQRGRRTSMFKNRAAPGSLYATLSAASAEARPRRSKSEERARVRTEGGRPRPRSMLPPSTARAGFEGRGRVRGGDEKYGFR